MAVKKKQSKLKKIIGAFNPKSFRGGMALFALLFAVTGGGYMLYRSFAETLPVYRTSYLDWRATWADRYSRSFTTDTNAGVICVAANFDTYNNPLYDYSYHWAIEQYEGGQWFKVRNSASMSANGNRDWHCYDDKIYKGKTYRVKFTPNERAFIHGTYWIWGHNHN